MACYYNGGVIRTLLRGEGCKGVAAVSVDVNFKLPHIFLTWLTGAAQVRKKGCDISIT